MEDHQHSTTHSGKHSRRVSISDQPAQGLDNPGFEHPRRISLTSLERHFESGKKKSILHHLVSSRTGSVENLHKLEMDQHNGKHLGLNRKKSAYSLSSSIRDKIEYSEELERSWLYLFCTRCHGRGDSDSWEPEGWKRACPQPFCPSYRKFARVVCLMLLGLLAWGIVFTMIGEDAAPGGELFGLAALAIVAHFAGWLVTLFNLPALIGMLLTGIIMQNTGLVAFGPRYGPVISDLRKMALVIILTRAGLDLDPKAMKKMRFTVPKIGLVPWFVEAAVVTVATHYFMDMPWVWGFLLGSIVAAVSPAVIVPCLFKLREKGYGVAKGIPTLIIAISGIDDAASVAIYGIVLSVIFSQEALWYQILQGPIAIFGGIGFGLIWGTLSRYVPEKGDPFHVPMRVLMLLGGGTIAVFGSEEINLGGAGPLAVVAASFVSCYFWTKDGWDIEDNPVATAFEIFWMIFEPILFSVTGTMVNIKELDPNSVYIGIGCLLAAVILRLVATVFVSMGSRFNLKEKIFIALACMAKATVQAALGPATAYAILEKNPDDAEQKKYGEIIVMFCVLSILLTAPLGALIITISGPKLLTKTRAPIATPLEGWRSRRPSIRDISIINELPEDSIGTPTILETVTNSNAATTLHNNIINHNLHDNHHR